MAKITFKNNWETNASIKRRISEKWGFMQSKIVLMEGSFNHLGVCKCISFQVCGLGYDTDFDTLDRSECFDEAWLNAQGMSSDGMAM